MIKKTKALPSQNRAEQCRAPAQFRPGLNVDDRRNWCFDKAEVDDAELVACCYWEYARESASVCDAVATAKAACASQGIPQQESEERETFRSAADKAFGLLTLTGFNISFWIGLHFPRPWQSLDKTKRKKWVDVCPKIPTPVKFPPFQVTGDLCTAGALYREVKKVHEAREALYWRLSQIDSGASNLEESTELRNKLSGQARHPTPVVVQGMGGVGSFVGQINWRDFTDNEIIACFERWVKAEGNRPVMVTKEPKGVRGVRGGRGRDPQEWRASLFRLGLLRLRHRQTVEVTIQTLCKTFPAKIYQAQKEEKRPTKFSEPGEINREAQKAVDDFHALFPFLDPVEKPVSWPLLE